MTEEGHPMTALRIPLRKPSVEGQNGTNSQETPLAVKSASELNAVRTLGRSTANPANSSRLRVGTCASPRESSEAVGHRNRISNERAIQHGGSIRPTTSLEYGSEEPSFLEKIHRYLWPKTDSDNEAPSPPHEGVQDEKCHEISVTQWIIRRIRKMIVFNKNKDPVYEEAELAPLRYRPVSLQKLSQTTKFTKEELQFMYRGFKQVCPTGVITEETFRSIYGKFFPLGNQPDDGSGRNSAMYAHYVFGTMDQEGVGYITFGDFIAGLSVLLKGTMQDRVNWVFNLYDINNDGYITKEELIDVVSSVYDLMGEEAHPKINDVTAVEHVDKLFERLDLNKDGVVTIDEFMEYCSKNEHVVSSLNIFDCI